MANEVDAYVGGRLRERRILKGLSQTALAETVGLTFQQIQKYERGTDRISASRLYQFSRVLGLPVSHFFDGLTGKVRRVLKAEVDTAGLAEGERIFTDRHTLQLVRNYYRIQSAADRRALLGLIRSLGKK